MGNSDSVRSATNHTSDKETHHALHIAYLARAIWDLAFTGTRPSYREIGRRLNRHHTTPALVDYVERSLQADWSPETITGRLQRNYPQNNRMRICTETI